MRHVRFKGSSQIIEIIGRIACFRLMGMTPFVKSNPRPTQLELNPSAQTKFVICDHTIDITYIPTAEGWLYLAGIMDLHSRKIVGWAMDKRMTGLSGLQNGPGPASASSGSLTPL
jgi:hypothetical protein